MDTLKMRVAQVCGTVAALTAGATAMFAKAAVDPDVASTTASLALTIKDNVVGAITANISTIVIGGVLILSILVIWRFSKRFVSGR